MKTIHSNKKDYIIIIKEWSEWHEADIETGRIPVKAASKESVKTTKAYKKLMNDMHNDYSLASAFIDIVEACA